MTARKAIPKRLVNELLLKSKRRCALCYSLNGDTTLKAGNIEHVRPIHTDGDDSIDNLVFLCAHHNAAVDRRGPNQSSIAELLSSREALYRAMDDEPQEETSRGQKVFIVHGRDVAGANEVKKLLTRLKLQPILLGERLNFGNSVIEKLEREMDSVKYAIALLTPDEPAGGPRQNVVFELGYLIGRLGFNRVLALLGPGLEVPSDLLGVPYVKMDAKGLWHDTLLRELLSAGLVSQSH